MIIIWIKLKILQIAKLFFIENTAEKLFFEFIGMNSAQYLIDNLRIIFIIQKYIKKEITVNFIKSKFKDNISGIEMGK